MKKIFISFIMVIIAGGMVFTQQYRVRQTKITISNPKLNSVWCTGKAYAITWKRTGLMHNQVSINLVHPPQQKGKMRLRGYNIASAAPNNGKYFYKVPGSVKPGKYVVRIRTLDGKVTATSPAFTVKLCPIIVKPDMKRILTMEVLKPKAGRIWDPGKKYTIKWKTNTKGSIKIQLYTYNKKFVKTIATAPKLPNGPQVSWTVPDNIKAGNYKIKVATLNNSVEGFSQKFTIRMYTTTRTYLVPVQYTVNKRKTTKKIKDDRDISCLPQLYAYGDPGPGKMRVGHHITSNSSVRCETLFRSFAYFDLKPYIGKGLILSAKLLWEKYGGAQLGGAYPNILTQKWDGGALSLFSVSAERAPSSGGFADITSTVQNWLAYPNQNYGIVFSIHDENPRFWPGYMGARYYTVHLKLEILEKK